MWLHNKANLFNPQHSSILTPHSLIQHHTTQKQNGAPSHMLYSFPSLGHFLRLSSLQEHAHPRGSCSGTAQDLAQEDMDEPWKPPWPQETPSQSNNSTSFSASWTSSVALCLIICLSYESIIKFLFLALWFIHACPFLCKSQPFQKCCSQWLVLVFCHQNTFSYTFQYCSCYLLFLSIIHTYISDTVIKVVFCAMILNSCLIKRETIDLVETEWEEHRVKKKLVYDLEMKCCIWMMDECWSEWNWLFTESWCLRSMLQ